MYLLRPMPSRDIALISLVLWGCSPQAPPEVQPAPSQPAAEVDGPRETGEIAPSSGEPPQAPPASASASAPALVSIHRDGDKSLRQLFDAELAAAETADQLPVVMFTADWCSPCKLLKESLESNSVVRRHTARARFLIIDVDEWRGPAQRLIPGTDPSKLPLLVRVDRQGGVMAQARGSRLGLLDGETTGANLARVMVGGDIVPPAYQEDKDRRRSLAVADSKRQRALVQGRVPFQMQVISREKLPDGGERLRLNLKINNNEAPRRYWALPSHAPLPKGSVEVPRLSVSRFEEHIRAGYFTYHTDPPITVIAAGNWGSIELQGYTVDVPAGTKQVAVHKLKQITVGGERATFAKKVPYELKITDASRLGTGRSVDNPGDLVLEIAESFSAKVTP